MIITIDGPTASGKSTVAKELADRLGFIHLNSGLLYRGIAYVLVNHFNYDEDKLRNPEQADLDEIVNSGDLKYSYKDSAAKVVYKDKEITSCLKNEVMDNFSSISSANQKVRDSLMAIQRKMAAGGNLVAEGRDTGTEVFPLANLKIFLTASLPVRASRWQADMRVKGEEFSLQESAELVNARDRRDVEREIAPLRVAQDAVEVDGSDMSLDEVVEMIFLTASVT